MPLFESLVRRALEARGRASKAQRDWQRLLELAAILRRAEAGEVSIRRCAWCQHFEVGGEWLHFTAIGEGELRIAASLLERATHGICPDCQQRELRGSEAGRVLLAEKALGRSTSMAPGSLSLGAAAVRVLAVDDDARSLELIVAVVGSLAEVTTVRSGESALEELEKSGYAVVLLDVAMPGIDGFETARLMKEKPSTWHTPVIFLTGQIGDEQVRRGYELGAADYLLKPFDPEILRAKVKVFVELARLRSEAEALSYRVLHDQLTGLPNRTLFFDRLEQALARLARQSGLLAVLFLDLDGFKSINDRLGHDAGDRLLIEFAARLHGSLRATDTAARFGGDEFLVLVEGLDDQREIERVAARIGHALAAPYRVGSEEADVTAAIGVAVTDDPNADPAALIQTADESMLRIKARRGSARFDQLIRQDRPIAS